jgi:hypothetical protein
MAVPKKKNKKVKFKYSKIKLFFQKKYKKVSIFCKFCLKGTNFTQLLSIKNINKDMVESHNSLIFRRVNTKSKICDSCKTTIKKEYELEEEKEKTNNIKNVNNSGNYLHF